MYSGFLDLFKLQDYPLIHSQNQPYTIVLKLCGCSLNYVTIIMGFSLFYKKNTVRRYQWASYIVLLGFALLLLSVVGYTAIDTPRRFIRLSIRLFILFPILVLIPVEFFRWKGRSWCYKSAVLLIGVVLISCFYGEETGSLKTIAKPLKDAANINAVLVAAGLIVPLIQKYQKYVAVFLILIAGVFIVPLYDFFANFKPNFRLGDPIPYSNVMGSVACGMAALMVNSLPKKSSLKLLIPAFIAMALLYSVLALTASRSAILGCLFLIAVFLCFSRDRRLCVLVFAAIVGLGMTSYSAKRSGVEDKREFSSLIKRKDAGRIKLWTSVLSRLEGSEKIFGRGYFAFSGDKKMHLGASHSVYVGTYYGSGAIALIFLIILMLLAAWNSCCFGFSGILLPISLLSVAVVRNIVDGSGVVVGNEAALIFWMSIVAVVAVLDDQRSKRYRVLDAN